METTLQPLGQQWTAEGPSRQWILKWTHDLIWVMICPAWISCACLEIWVWWIPLLTLPWSFRSSVPGCGSQNSPRGGELLTCRKVWLCFLPSSSHTYTHAIMPSLLQTVIIIGLALLFGRERYLPQIAHAGKLGSGNEVRRGQRCVCACATQSAFTPLSKLTSAALRCSVWESHLVLRPPNVLGWPLILHLFTVVIYPSIPWKIPLC